MSATIRMLVKPRYLITRDMKYVDLASYPRSMGYYHFAVEVPGLASTMDKFQLRVDTCNDIPMMSPKEQEAYYRVVDVLVSKGGAVVTAKVKTKTKTRGKTKVHVAGTKKHTYTVHASKPGVKMTSIRRRWGRPIEKKVKHDGYKIKPEDQIKIVQIRSRVSLLNDKLLKTLTVKVESKSVSLHDVIINKKYTAVLTDLAGSDQTKVYNGTKVIKVTRPVKCKRQSSILRAFTWLSNKYKDTWLTTSSQVQAKVKLLEKKSTSASSWVASRYKAEANKQRRFVEQLKQLETSVASSKTKTKDCLLVCLSGLEYYYDDKVEAITPVASVFAIFNWKLNIPKYQKKISEQVHKQLQSGKVSDLANLTKRDITSLQKFDLVTIVPEMASMVDTDLYKVLFNQKIPAKYRTAANKFDRLKWQRFSTPKAKEKLARDTETLKEPAARYTKLRELYRSRSTYFARHEVLGLAKATKFTASGATKFAKQFVTWDTNLKYKATELRTGLLKLLALYFSRLDKLTNSRGEFSQLVLNSIVGPSGVKRLANAKATERKRLLALNVGLKTILSRAVSTSKSAIVRGIKDKIKDAPAREKAQAILESDKRTSLLSANELHELKPDDIRALVNANKGYDILWFLYPKSKQFKPLFSKTFTSEQNEMLKRLPSKTVADGIMHMYQTDKAALTKAQFDASVLRDTNVANAIMSVAFKTHTDLMDSLPFKGLTVKQLFSSHAAVKANNIDFNQSKVDAIISKVGNAGTLVQTIDKLTLKLISKFSSPKMKFVASKDKFDPTPYMSNLHTIDVHIKHVYDLASIKEPDVDLLPYYIPVAFHGTSTLSASLISIFGFTTKWRKVGRALGDGVYFAPNIDKSAQYLGATGFTRGDTTGVIFLARIYLPSNLRETKQDAKPRSRFGMNTSSKTINFKNVKGVSFTNRFRTQEACVFSSLIPYVVLEKALICSPKNKSGGGSSGKSTTTFKIVKRTKVKEKTKAKKAK